MTSQFSPKVSQVLAFSREEATRLASQSVGPEHLLLGIMREHSDSIMELFYRQGVDVQAVKAELEMRVKDDMLSRPLNTRDLSLPSN